MNVTRETLQNTNKIQAKYIQNLQDQNAAMKKKIEELENKLAQYNIKTK